jgi:hypothetical protein
MAYTPGLCIRCGKAGGAASTCLQESGVLVANRVALPPAYSGKAPLETGMVFLELASSKTKKNPDHMVGATGCAVTLFFSLLPPVNGRNDLVFNATRTPENHYIVSRTVDILFLSSACIIC